MTAATKEDRRTSYRYDSAWLYLLLEDIRRETAGQPSPQSIMRIRAQLLEQMKTPVKAAA